MKDRIEKAHYGHKWSYIEGKYDKFPPDDSEAEWNDGWFAAHIYL